MAAGVSVPVSGGEIVVLGGGTACQACPDRPLAANQATVSDLLPRQGSRTPFLVSPFYPPVPRFICLGQLLAFRQDWLVCALRQQLPQITAAGLKNGPLKQRRLTESASLYLTRSESNLNNGALLGSSHLQPARAHSSYTVCVGKAFRGNRSRHPPRRQRQRQQEHDRRHGRSLAKR